MTMTVLRYARDVGDSNYQTRAFRAVLEDHLDLIKSNAVTTAIVPTARQFGKFKGDFTGLLIELKVPEKLHWITTRVNGLHSPMDYLDETQTVSLLNPSYIEAILDRHLSTLSRV